MRAVREIVSRFGTHFLRRLTVFAPQSALLELHSKRGKHQTRSACRVHGMAAAKPGDAITCIKISAASRASGGRVDFDPAATRTVTTSGPTRARILFISLLFYYEISIHFQPEIQKKMCEQKIPTVSAPLSAPLSPPSPHTSLIFA